MDEEERRMERMGRERGREGVARDMLKLANK